jgi:hypothetical protein
VARASHSLHRLGRATVRNLSEAGATLQRAAVFAELQLAVVDHSQSLSQLARVASALVSGRDVVVRSAPATAALVRQVDRILPRVTQEVLLSTSDVAYNLHPDFLVAVFDRAASQMPTVVVEAEQDTGIVSSFTPPEPTLPVSVPAVELPKYAELEERYRAQVSPKAYSWIAARLSHEQRHLHRALFARPSAREGWQDLGALDFGLPDVTGLELMSYQRALWQLVQSAYSSKELQQLLVTSAGPHDPADVLQKLDSAKFRALAQEYSISYSVSSSSTAFIGAGGASTSMAGFWRWLQEADYRPLAMLAQVELHTSTTQRAALTIAAVSDFRLASNVVDPADQAKVAKKVLLKLADAVSQEEESHALVSVLATRATELLTSAVLPEVHTSQEEQIEKVVETRFPKEAEDIYQRIRENTQALALPDPQRLARRNTELLQALRRGLSGGNDETVEALQGAGEALLRLDDALAGSLEVSSSRRWRLLEGDSSAVWTTLRDIAAAVDFDKVELKQIQDREVRDVLESAQQLSQRSLFRHLPATPQPTVLPDLTQLLVQTYHAPAVWSRSYACVLDALHSPLSVQIPAGRFPTHIAMLASSVGMTSVVPTAPLATKVVVAVSAGIAQQAAPDLYPVASRGLAALGPWWSRLSQQAQAGAQTTWQNMPDAATQLQHVATLALNLAGDIAKVVGEDAAEAATVSRVVNSNIAFSAASVRAQSVQGATAAYKGMCWSLHTLDQSWLRTLQAWRASQDGQDEEMAAKAHVLVNLLREWERRSGDLVNDMLSLYEKNLPHRSSILQQVGAWSQQGPDGTLQSLRQFWQKAQTRTDDTRVWLATVGTGLLDQWTAQGEELAAVGQEATRELAREVFGLDIDESLERATLPSFQSMSTAVQNKAEQLQQLIFRLRSHQPTTRESAEADLRELIALEPRQKAPHLQVQTRAAFRGFRKAAKRRIQVAQKPEQPRELARVFGSQSVTGSLFPVVNVPAISTIGEYEATPTRAPIKTLPQGDWNASLATTFGDCLFDSQGDLTATHILYSTPTELTARAAKQLERHTQQEFGRLTPSTIVPATVAGRSRLGSLLPEEVTFHDLMSEFALDVQQGPLVLKPEQAESHLLATYMTGMQVAESPYKLDVDISATSPSRTMHLRALMQSEVFRWVHSVFVPRFGTWATVIATEPREIPTANVQLSTNLPFALQPEALFQDERAAWQALMRGTATDTDMVGVVGSDGTLYVRPIHRGNLQLSYQSMLQDVLGLVQTNVEDMLASGARRMVDLVSTTVEEPMTRADLLAIVDAAASWGAAAEVSPKRVVQLFVDRVATWRVPRVEPAEVEQIVAKAYRQPVRQSTWEVQPSANFLLRLKESAGGSRTALSDLLAIPGLTEKQLLARFQQWLAEKHSSSMEVVQRPVRELLRTNANPALLLIRQLGAFSRALGTRRLRRNDIAAVDTYLGSGAALLGRFNSGMPSLATVLQQSVQAPTVRELSANVEAKSYLEVGPLVTEELIHTGAAVASIAQQLYASKDRHRLFSELVVMQLLLEGSSPTPRSLARACLVSFLTAQSANYLQFYHVPVAADSVLYQHGAKVHDLLRTVSVPAFGFPLSGSLEVDGGRMVSFANIVQDMYASRPADYGERTRALVHSFTTDAHRLRAVTADPSSRQSLEVWSRALGATTKVYGSTAPSRAWRWFALQAQGSNPGRAFTNDEWMKKLADSMPNVLGRLRKHQVTNSSDQLVPMTVEQKPPAQKVQTIFEEARPSPLTNDEDAIDLRQTKKVQASAESSLSAGIASVGEYLVESLGVGFLPVSFLGSQTWNTRSVMQEEKRQDREQYELLLAHQFEVLPAHPRQSERHTRLSVAPGVRLWLTREPHPLEVGRNVVLTLAYAQTFGDQVYTTGTGVVEVLQESLKGNMIETLDHALRWDKFLEFFTLHLHTRNVAATAVELIRELRQAGKITAAEAKAASDRLWQENLISKQRQQEIMRIVEQSREAVVPTAKSEHVEAIMKLLHAYSTASAHALPAVTAFLQISL